MKSYCVLKGGTFPATISVPLITTTITATTTIVALLQLLLPLVPANGSLTVSPPGSKSRAEDSVRKPDM